MEQSTIRQTVAQVGTYLEKGGYAKGTLLQFKSTTNQLLKFMDAEGVAKYNTGIGIRFLQINYAYDPKSIPTHSNAERLRCLQKLSEFQLYGTPVLKRTAGYYNIPLAFCKATDAFLAYRRFEGIVERNMSTISLYLERFFGYLTAQSVTQLSQITGTHIYGFLRFITGYSNTSKDHMMRTVRQFMGFCFKNGYLSENLSAYAPCCTL